MHFRLVSHLVHAGVQEHHAQHGSVCPGQFVYHYFDVPTYDEGNDVTWSFELHSGDVYYLTRHAHAPLKLTQPYDHADSEDHVLHRTHTEVQNCHVLDGRYYLALRGGEHCAEYDVGVEVTLGMGAAATSGSFTGGSFHAYDFQSHPEDLIVVLDGVLVTVHLTEDIADVSTAVTILEAALGGDASVSVHEDHGNIVITSPTTGSSSWIEIDGASGTHALELFGHGTALYGHAAGSHECHELHATLGGGGNGLTALWENHFYYDMCEPFGYVDYEFEVTHEMADNNLVFEVEDLGRTNNPESLGVYLYFSTIPLDRKTERYKEAASDGLWTNAVSQHDLLEGMYYLSVRCGPGLVHYRVLTQLIQAHIQDGATVHGEICPGDWVYHYYPYVPEVEGNSTADSGGGGGGGHGRRLQAHGVPETIRICASR